MKKIFYPLAIAALLAVSCGQKKTNEAETGLDLDPARFEKTIDGKQTGLSTLKNSNGVSVAITNYGGRIVGILTPDSEGDLEDVCLGYNSLDDYFNNEEQFFGALIGRYGNRIANGKFTLNEQEYTLAQNDGVNHLHGGPKGFHKAVWDVAEYNPSSLELHYLSSDMEGGYPGNLDVTVTYTLNDENELKIEYRATTDKPTVVNLTNHCYFNLAGEGSGESVNDHLLTINADQFTPVNSTLIPLGENMPVEGTPFDFRTPKQIGRDIEDQHEQLLYGKGFDHNFVLNKPNEGEMTLAARVVEPESGRSMEVYTTEPGVQFYGGNFMHGKNSGKAGVPYGHRMGFCLETQHFPDSPNQENFPSTTLNPGETYSSTTIYKFTAEDKEAQ